MSDIEKLRHVIAELEKQSSSVTEFSGTLKAINSARMSIVATKTVISKLVKDHKALASESHQHFDEYSNKLTVLESKIKLLEKAQAKTIKEISVLDFATPEQIKQTQAAIEKSLSEQTDALSERIDQTSTDQKSAINSLKLLLIIVVLLLTIGMVIT